MTDTDIDIVERLEKYKSSNEIVQFQKPVMDIMVFEIQEAAAELTRLRDPWCFEIEKAPQEFIAYLEGSFTWMSYNGNPDGDVDWPTIDAGKPIQAYRTDGAPFAFMTFDGCMFNKNGLYVHDENDPDDLAAEISDDSDDYLRIVAWSPMPCPPTERPKP